MTNSQWYEASAPGTLFLMGEHSVLRGQRAITAAVDQRLTVRLQPRSDQMVTVKSTLGDYQSPLLTLADDSRFSFVLAAIQQQLAQLQSGFDLVITSDFSHEVGLGSSAAVTVATLGALQAWLAPTTPLMTLFEQSLAVMRRVQKGKGSGADLAACVYGGCVAYQIDPLHIEPLQGVPSIQLFFSGYKMKTPDVIAHVEAQSETQPGVYAELYRLMGSVTEQAIAAVNAENWTVFGQLMNTYHGLMDALGVCDKTLATMVYQLREEGAFGAKISGSGLGDCVYALISENLSLSIDYPCLSVRLSPVGLVSEVSNPEL